MTARFDFSLRQGNTFRLKLRLRDGRDNALDLTGSVLTLSIADGQRETVRYSTKTGELVISAPRSGEVTIALSADATRKLPVGSQHYEIERSFAETVTSPGEETTILTGMIVVQRGMNP